MIDRTKAPEIHHIGEFSTKSPDVKVLSNGIKLHLLNAGSEEVVRLSMYVDGGLSEFNDKWKPTLIPVCVREGTSSYSSRDVSELLDFNGAWYSGKVHQHHIEFTFHTLTKTLEKVLPVMMEVLFCPSFPEKECSIAIEMVARRLEIEMEKESYYADKEAKKLVSGPMHPSVDDYMPDDLRNADLRQILKDYKRMLHSGSINLFVVGHITPEIEKSIVDTFETVKLKGGGLAQDIRPLNPVNGTTIVIPRPDAKQSAVRATLPAVGRSHPDYIPLRVALMALGGYFGSRLISNIREDKGYTYGIMAGLYGILDGGYIKIDTECDARYVQPLLNEIRREIVGMSQCPVTADELERLKSNYLTSLASQVDSPFSLMDMSTSHLTIGTPVDYFQQQVRYLEKVTPENIVEISRKYLKDELLSIVIAGNHD